MKVPRAAFVRFPYGNPLGAPGDAETQSAIMKEALTLIAELEEPDLIVKLPFRWRGSSL